MTLGPISAYKGDLVSVVGTTDSPISLGLASTGDVDYFKSESQGALTNLQFSCVMLEIGMSKYGGGGIAQGGRFSMDWKIPHTGTYYLVFYNDSPLVVNVSVHLYQTTFTLFTNTLIETPTVTMTKTVTQVGVAPTLIYQIKDNIQLIVAVVLLCLVASALGLRRRTRRKKPESDTEEPVAVEKPTETSPDRNKATMSCNKCGAPIPPESKFCKECGTKQP
jgi:ribosomal protein L40E